LIVVANKNNANIRFTYWAERKLDIVGMIAVSAASIVVLTAIAVTIIFYVYSKLLNDTLSQTKKKIE
jgi:hypothetical protein